MEVLPYVLNGDLYVFFYFMHEGLLIITKTLFQLKCPLLHVFG